MGQEPELCAGNRAILWCVGVPGKQKLRVSCVRCLFRSASEINACGGQGKEAGRAEGQDRCDAAQLSDSLRESQDALQLERG